MEGSINAIKFSKDNTFLVAAHGKEQRLGRWHVNKNAHEGISVVKLF
jgi:hypothetical protein